MYCANVARTYVIDPSKEQEAQYRALLDAQAAAIGALVEGAPLSAAHEAATATLQVRSPPSSRIRVLGLEVMVEGAPLAAAHEAATPTLQVRSPPSSEIRGSGLKVMVEGAPLSACGRHCRPAGPQPPAQQDQGGRPRGDGRGRAAVRRA